MKPFYRIRFHDGSHFDYFGATEPMRAEVARISPEDVAGYDAFMTEADLCYRLGYEELGTVPFETLARSFRPCPPW